MDQEKMANELDRILEKLSKVDPLSEEYTKGIRNFSDLMDSLHKELRSCDESLANDQKRAIDKEKLELEKDKENHARIQAKKEAILGIIKQVIVILGMSGCIVLTVFCEQSSIISQKAFSFLKFFKP